MFSNITTGSLEYIATCLDRHLGRLLANILHKISLLVHGMYQVKSVQKPCLTVSCGQGLKICISAWLVGHTVAQLVEALCYKLEGHGYPDGVIGIIHWHNPSGYTMALGVNSASNRSKYQEYFLGDKGGWCVGLTTLPS
jgi:hypothetical protein